MKSLMENEMISIIRKGLPPSSSPKRVVVVGAGMAGLVTASLLKEAGHQVVVLEGSQRVGGRIYTIRSPFTHGFHFEAGAMRIPSNHTLVWEYIRKFGLKTHPFINSTPWDWIYTNGVKIRRWEYEENPDILKYPVLPRERGKTAEELLRIISRQIDRISRQSPCQRLDLVREMEKFSLDTFLKYNPFGITLSPGAVEMIRVLLGVQGLSELSFGELHDLLTTYFIDSDVQFYEIIGGNDLLPRSFLSQLKNRIWYGHIIEKIISYSDRVTIVTKDANSGHYVQTSGDYAVITIPFSALKRVKVEPYHAFSHNKRKAIRELHYVPATKVGIEFGSRFWEKEGIFGGQTATDLPIRFTYYPSQEIGSTGPAVILASYTWKDDTLVWDSLSEGERMKLALQDLSRIYGNVVFREFVTGVSVSWRQKRFTTGCFVIYKPGQKEELLPYVAIPEGRVHFAGEHTSVHYRAWIQGAIETGIRAAHEVHLRNPEQERDGQRHQG